jgi:hypothetical protein
MGVSSSHGRSGRPVIRWAFAFIVIALTTIFSLPESIRATENVIPFRPGERLTFQAKWSFIPAGEAVLEILPIENLKGVRSYHFVITAKTYPYIDLIYKVRDRIDAFTDVEMTHSLLYEEKKEGKRKKNVVVNFNWEKQEAEYSNFGEKRKPISLMPGSFDPLSVFYAFRLHELEENKELRVPVTDGKKCVIGKAKILKREKVKVASGTYDTYLVVPDLEHIGGVFAKTEDAKIEIWVTADTRKIPVKIKSKVVVGSFVGELISVETVGKDVTVSTR